MHIRPFSATDCTCTAGSSLCEPGLHITASLLRMERSLDGWLSKLAKTRSSRGGAAPMWQRRWFTLRGDQLCCYHIEQDAASGVPKWSLDLGASGAAASMYASQPPDPTRIELQAGDEQFSLRAESEVEAEMWLAALVTPARGDGPPDMPAAVSAVMPAPPAKTPNSAFDFLSGGAPSVVAQPAAPPPSPANPSPISAFNFLSGGGGGTVTPLAAAVPSAMPPTLFPGDCVGIAAPPLPTDDTGVLRKKKVVRKAKIPGGGSDWTEEGGNGSAGAASTHAPSAETAAESAAESAAEPAALNNRESAPTALAPPAHSLAPASVGGGGLPLGMFDGLDMGGLPPTSTMPAADAAPTSAAVPPSDVPSSDAAASALPSAFDFLSGGGCAPASGLSFLGGTTLHIPNVQPRAALSSVTSAAGAKSAADGEDAAIGCVMDLVPAGAALGGAGASGGGLSGGLCGSLGGDASAGLESMMMMGSLPRSAIGSSSIGSSSIGRPVGVLSSVAAAAAEKARKAEKKKAKVAKAAAAPAAVVAAPPPPPPPPHDEDLELRAKSTQTEAAAATLHAQRRSVHTTQAESIRWRGSLVSELSRLQAAAQAATSAQAEAASEEDYERAAQLAGEIEQLQAREASCTAGINEAGRAYDLAEAQKAQLDVDELELYGAHAAECRRCLAARREKARREAAASDAALSAETAALEAEGSRLAAEESAFASKETELTAKLEAASASIAEETRESMAAKASWVAKGAEVDAVIVELSRQLELRQAEAAQYAAHVSRCDAAVGAVHTKYGKAIKRLQSKQDALAASRETSLKARRDYESAKARHDREFAARADVQARRDLWIADAADAQTAAVERIEAHKVVSSLAMSVTQAAAALQAHKAAVKEQLQGLEEELTRCRASQRTHSDQSLQLLAEAELLLRQVGAAEDQKVRLELEKKLAASSQKFAEAAKLSAELKMLVGQIEASRASHTTLLARVEGERAAQAREAAREADLEGEQRNEQRGLDETQFKLLRNHEEALRALLPRAEAMQVELLQFELGSCVAALGALRSNWGWDVDGQVVAREAGAAATAATADDDDDDDDSDDSDDSNDVDDEAATPLAHLGLVPGGVPMPPPQAAPSIAAALTGTPTCSASPAFSFLGGASATATPPNSSDAAASVASFAAAAPEAAPPPPPNSLLNDNESGSHNSDDEAAAGRPSAAMDDTPAWLRSAASAVLGESAVASPLPSQPSTQPAVLAPATATPGDAAGRTHNGGDSSDDDDDYEDDAVQAVSGGASTVSAAPPEPATAKASAMDPEAQPRLLPVTEAQPLSVPVPNPPAVMTAEVVMTAEAPKVGAIGGNGKAGGCDGSGSGGGGDIAARLAALQEQKDEAEDAMQVRVGVGVTVRIRVSCSSRQMRQRLRCSLLSRMALTKPAC